MRGVLTGFPTAGDCVVLRDSAHFRAMLIDTQGLRQVGRMEAPMHWTLHFRTLPTPPIQAIFALARIRASPSAR